MISFKQFITEGLSSLRYSIPKNKQQLLYDFYVISGVPTWVLEPKKETIRNYDDIIYAHNEVKSKLLPYLKQHLLDMVEFSLSSEFSHVFDFTAYDKIIDKMKNEDFFKKYYSALTKKKFDDKEYSPTFRRYAYQALKSTKISSIDFVKLAEESFTKLTWAKDYGGKAWARIAKGWLRLNSATKEGDLFVAIDHIYDLQHNTDTVFNKITQYADSENSYTWIKDALDKKKHATSILDFYNDVTPSLKTLMTYAVKAAYGMTVEEYLKSIPVEDIDEIEKKAKSIKSKNKVKDFNTWTSGTWPGGKWNNGIWENGEWLDGLWKGGLWQNGIWRNGIWEDGTWQNGTWEDGIWKGGTWKAGRWKNGKIYDPQKKEYVKSKVSPKEYFAK